MRPGTSREPRRAHRLEATAAWLLGLSLAGIAPAQVPAGASGREGGAPRAARPWYGDFAARRRLDLPEGIPRGESVLVRLATAGLTREDGRDVRVVLEHQQALPLEILEAGPGDEILLRFPGVAAAGEYHAYFGNPQAPPPRKLSRRLTGGLLLEVRELPPGPCESWEDARALLAAAGEPIAVLTPRAVSLGLPPRGKKAPFLLRYRGYLEIREPGEHTFETASSGASFAVVGGKPAASWPGFHGLGGYGDPRERALHSGKVRLRPGRVGLEYVVAAREGGVHVLGWAGPGEERTRPVPPGRFLQWRWARAGSLEPRAGARVADFTWAITSDTNSDAERHDLAEVRYQLDRAALGARPEAVRWRFGDGQEAAGEEVEHVYLRHGLYGVEAEVLLAGGERLEARRRVAVRFESLERLDLDRLLERYHRRTERYDLAPLPASHLRQLIWLRGKDHRWEEALQEAVAAWFARGLSAADGEVAALGLERARAILAEGGREELALGILGRLAAGAPSPGERLEARAWRLWIDASRGDREALEALRDLYAGAGTGDAARRVGILLGRAELAAGEEERARAVLEPLDGEPGLRRYRGSRELAHGARRLGFESLLRGGHRREAREALELWEWELPADLLAGEIQAARARYERAAGRLEEALREVRLAGRLEGARREWPRFWLLEAEVLEAAGREGEARRRLEALVREFPQRPESREAEARLAGGGDGTRGAGEGS